MAQIIESLLPIILLVFTGACLLRLGFYDTVFRAGLDRFVYWVALPALIVAKLALAPAVGDRALPVVGVFAAATVAGMALSYVVAYAMRLKADTVGVFAQASFRGNLAFVGLPVVVLASDGNEDTAALAVLVLAPMVLFYNVLSVVALSLAQHPRNWLDRRALWRLLKSLVTNPLLVACAVGLVLSLAGWLPPGPVVAALDLVGKTAAPLALLSLGGAVVSYHIHRHVGVGAASAAIKLAVIPALVLLLAWVFGLDPQQRLVALIFAATPTAVASYVLAIQMRGDPAVAAATIVISTLLSALSLAAAMGLA